MSMPSETKGMIVFGAAIGVIRVLVVIALIFAVNSVFGLSIFK